MKIKKGALLFLMSFIMTGLLVKSAGAFVGVSPPRYYIEYEPGKKHVFVFDFSTDENLELEVYAEGDLAEYITLSTDRIQGNERVSVLLELPKRISLPGEHVIYIGARQIVSQDNLNGISLVGNIRGSIRVFVPYPGKYAVMGFSAFDSKVGLPGNFSISLSNQGTEDIHARGKIAIIDEKKEIIEEIDAGDWIMDPGQSESRFFASKNYFQAGKYAAMAILDYEGGTLKDEKSFRIGELSVAITGYTKRLIKNKLNKFDIGIESLWNDPIENIRANVTILEYPISFSTPSVDLQGFQDANLSGYFDTSIIQEDSVRARISLIYAGKTTEKIVRLRFKGAINYALTGLIAGLIIAVIVILILVMWIKRLENAKNAKRKK